VSGLRKKDVALLVYLCVEGTTVHPRGRLAALLWGDSSERRARHSLTQALGRLNRSSAAKVVAVGKDVVRCAPGVECDAVALLRGGMDAAAVDDEFSLYPGPFLEGFDAGRGAEEFHAWADRWRAELRNAALRLLERAGEQAAAAGEWRRALRLAERAVAIDPVWEEGHRRVMRAQAARGERNRALRHYQAFEAWLAEEVGAEPDPETRALAEQLRTPESPPERPAPPLAVFTTPLARPLVPVQAFEAAAPVEPAEAARTADVSSSLPPGGVCDAFAGPCETMDRDPRGRAARFRRIRTAFAGLIGTVATLALTALLTVLVRGCADGWSGSGALPGDGESPLGPGAAVYLAETLYAAPGAGPRRRHGGAHAAGCGPNATPRVRLLPEVAGRRWQGAEPTRGKQIIPRMTEIRVTDWNELNEQLYGNAYNPRIGRIRSPYAFRGVSNANYSLTTSLSRLGGAYAQMEQHLLRNFRKYARRSDVQTDSVWNWLAVAQHHGLPTRLLDWTFSPQVAMHFATARLREFDCDALIWTVDFVGAHALLPAPLREEMEHECADVFTVEMLARRARTLEEFDALSDEPFALFFEPPSLDDRIVNQFALFAAMSSPQAHLEDWLAAHPELVRRIVIPAELKWEVRDKLDQANVTERVLFPGLDGLSAWLKRYYSPRTP
jgi:DNA-binding SARP family transcriptional activator